jgi:hypothetical protein
MRRFRPIVVVFFTAVLACLCVCVSALASSVPVIESEAVTNLTEHDATLQAQINSNGLETAYEFQIDTNGSYNYTKPDCPLGECDSITVGEPLPAGLVEPKPEYIPAGSGDQTVSLDLATIGATLQPSTTYHYKVIAKSGGFPAGYPMVQGPDQTFTTPPTAPRIESESVSNITPTDAMLEAKITTDGLPTLYQFTLKYQPCSYHGVFYCELAAAVHIPLPSGELLGSFVGQSASLDLNSAAVYLRPGNGYEYSVVATSADGGTESQSQTFEALGGGAEPLSTTTSPPSAADQPPGPNTNRSSQPPGSGSPSSSSTPGAQSPDSQVGKTTKLQALTSAQKFSNALKACDKKPQRQRATCKRQARKTYGPAGKAKGSSRKNDR